MKALVCIWFECRQISQVHNVMSKHEIHINGTATALFFWWSR